MIQRVGSAEVERRWRWPLLVALLVTIPAFYNELLLSAPAPWSHLSYALAAVVAGGGLAHVALASSRPALRLRSKWFDGLLVAGLAAAALAPTSHDSEAALGLRLAVAFLTLTRMVLSLRHLVTRGGLAYLLSLAALVLALCGAGFWWLEPTTPRFADGLWLAFTTAATVGYGDVVPTTPASKIFAVFVVMFGWGVLTLVTAAIAARWVEDDERVVERTILAQMHREMALLREELAALRQEVAAGQAAADEPAAGSAQATQARA